MKNNGLILFQILFSNQYRISELKDKSSKYRRNAIITGIIITILIGMIATYSFGMGFALGSMGIAKVIPGYGITIVSLITLFFTIFKSNGTLFGFKDYDMLISLPIKISTIIASRFFYMYFMNTIFATIVMVPLGIAYYIFEKPEMSFIIIWLIGILLATLIPTTLAAVIGAIIVYVASHFKYTNAFVTISSVVLVVAIIVAPMFIGNANSSTFDINQLTNIGEMISQQNKSIYPISALFEKAVVDNSLIALLLFIVISVCWYLLFLTILSTKYKSINTAIMTHSAKSNYKLTELKTSSVLFALYKKELKRFFSSNVYVLNVGMGAIMALVMTIAVFVLEPSKLEEMMQVSNLENVLIKIIAFGFAGVLSMSCSTSVSLSLEGKNLWILKSLPVKTKTIVNSKILVNLTITMPIALVFGILMNVKFQSDWITRILLIVTPVVYSFFVAVWGMFINIKLPNFEWESETALIKQGLASMIGMLGGALFSIFPIGAILFLNDYPYQLIQMFATVLFGFVSVLLYRAVCNYKI